MLKTSCRLNAECLDLLFDLLTNMSRVKRWCFTLNNYTADEYACVFPLSVDASYGLPPVLDYACVGKEIGAAGTPHLQGFCSFRERTRISGCRSLLPRAHWEVARSVKRAIEYCKKDGDFLEVGEAPPESAQGRRTDLELFKAAVKSGVRDRKDIREEFSSVCAQYPKFVESYLRDQYDPPSVEDHTLRTWQQNLVEVALGPVDPRVIHFVVDKDGNAGKSWLASYLECKIQKIVQVMKPGKFADMAYGYVEENDVFILDCPRSKQGDFIQYDFLESIKDGRLFSSKYESRMKVFKPPHVFVFMNQDPDMEKLSIDRYVFIDTSS